MNLASFHIVLAPLLPEPALASLAGAAAILSAFAILRRAKGAGIRTLALAAMLAALANPVLVAEKREPLKDTVLVVADASASMEISDRQKQAERAKSALLKSLAQYPDLEVETVAVDGRDKTDLFRAMGPKLAAIPPNRLAGIIAITDGQTHDAPEGKLPAPFHALLAGSRNEINRKLVIKSAPSFAVVGKEASIALRVEDYPRAQGDTATVLLRQSGEAQDRVYHVPVGKDFPMSVPVKQGGANLFAFEAENIPGEISALDNGAAVSVNGIRDRLRVLLVSGTPHIGARVWRGLLKSDPAIDLLHFTILRTPFSSARVPQQEMSLIAFPTRELFEEKLSGFDLVIFDRFSDHTLVPERYLENIAQYVRNGGALLISHATEDVGVLARDRPALGESIRARDDLGALSPLAQILPVKTAGRIASGTFTPAMTAEGERHPVTEDLAQGRDSASWTPWRRQVETDSDAQSGHAQILLSGLQGRPLLALDRVGKGRVAQFLSDQFWLWSRGGGNEGPQIPLMRRVVHWLMQEPELDETALRASAAPSRAGKGWTIAVAKRSLGEDSERVTVERPDGKMAGLMLARNTPSTSSLSSENRDKTGKNLGALRGMLDVDEPGIYRVREADAGDESVEPRETLVMAGPLDAPEYADLRASDRILAPHVKSGGGGIFWLEDRAEGPKIQRTAPDSSQSGWGWIGLRRNGQYRITGSESVPLAPVWAVLAAILAISMLAWRREGR